MVQSRNALMLEILQTPTHVVVLATVTWRRHVDYSTYNVQHHHHHHPTRILPSSVRNSAFGVL